MIRGETVTLIKRSVAAERDALNNDQYEDASVPFSGAVFAPGGTTEGVQGQELVTTSDQFIWIGVIPDLSAVDAILRPNGDKYEVDGDQPAFESPFSGTKVLAVNVTKVSG